MKRRLLAMLLLMALALSLIPTVGAENTAEHHLLLADDFTPGGWTKEPANAAHGPLTANTLKGHTDKTGSNDSATATVTVTSEGVYHVWAHVLYHQATEPSATSWKTKVAVNGTALSTVFGGHHNAADAYVWVDGGEVELRAGENAVAFNDNEYKNYARADGIWLTSTNLDPRGKSLAELQAAAAGQKQEPVFDAAKAVIADNDAGKALSGTWTASTWRVGYYGNNYLNGKDSNTEYQWTLNVPETTEYELWIHIPSGYQHSGTQKETDNLYVDVCQTASYTVSQNGTDSAAYLMSHEKRAGWYCVEEGISLEAGEAAVTLNTGALNGRTAFADAVALQNPAAQSTGKTYLDDGLENVVDNREKEAAEQGAWTLKTNSNAYLGDYAVSSEKGASFTWTLTIPEDASYDIAWFCADFYNASSVTDQANYQLIQNGTVVAENVTTQRLEKGWYPLFSAELNEGTAQITLTNSGSAPLMADAVRATRTLIAGKTAMTLDNLDANAVHSGAASQWKKGLKVGTYIGADYELATGENSDITFFRWPVEVYGAGWWKVEAYLPENSSQTGLSNAVSYEIVHKNKTDAVTLDHSTKTGWTELGCWEFTGDTESISVVPAKGQVGWAYVDAVRLTYMGQNDPSAEWWIVDNTDRNTIRTGTFPSGTTTRGWQNPSTWRAGYVGDNYYSLKKRDADASFTWQFQIPKDGYYAVSINLPDCKTGMDGEGASYQILSWDTETSAEQFLTKRLSHSAEAGWYQVARVYLKASDDLQNVLKLTGPTNGVCVVDAAKLEYIGAELPVESGSYRIDLEDEQQTILGLGVEIQSESLGSGNTMDETDLQHSVPHDLTQSERERLYTDMLSGFRYMRLAGGLFYRGTDEEQKHLVPHWDTQDEELAELLQKSGIEGFNFEFWSPTPYFKSTGKYHGGTLKCFDENWEYAASKVGQARYEEEKQKFLEEFADTIIADFLRMRAAGLPVVQFSLQNEPPLKSVYGTYSFCYYSEQNYYETCKVVLPRLKAAFPDLFIHAPSWDQEPRLWYDSADGQTLYVAQNVCNGEHRIWNAPNLWQSAADDLQPELTLTWKKPVRIREIRMYLDPDLLMELPSSRATHIEPSHVYIPRTGMPAHLIRSMTVTAFDERDVPLAVWKIEENIQRLLVLQLDKPQKISKLTVAIRSTWGQAEARIFRILAYEQCLTDGLKAEMLNGERDV